MDILLKAYETYKLRQDRSEHPDGNFDLKGRWFPSETERRECCETIRYPTRRFPYSLLLHCRSIKHIANLFNVDEKELRRLITTRGREGGDNYYKLVALLPDGRMVSVYDGTTEYQLGVTLSSKAPRRGHRGGYYVYADEDSARHACFPAGSVYGEGGARYALLRCRAEGAYCRYGRKLAFARVTPLEVVEVL